MEDSYTKNAQDPTIDKTVSEIRNFLLLPVDRETIHKIRESVILLREQLKSKESLSPSAVNRIVLLMQEVYEVEETFIHSGIRNVEGAPQLRHDLFSLIATLPEIIDTETEDIIELTPDLKLFDWLMTFKDSDEFNRKAKHPLSLSHITIRALILFALDNQGFYDVKNIFRTISAAVFKGHLHPSYFEYATRYVRLKF